MVLHGSILNTNRSALVTALAETYLTLSVCRQTARIRRFGSLLQPRFKQLQRDLLVSILGALALTSDGKACQLMFDNGDGFDFIDILAAGARSPARGPFQVALGIWTRQLAGSGSTATVIVDVWMRPLRSVGGTRCHRWPPLSLANKAWACGPSTRNTTMPGRSSSRSRLKTPPSRKLEIDAELIADKQLGVGATFRGADFDNTHGYSPLGWDKGKGNTTSSGYSEAADWDADVNTRFTC
jgi:hypothetical protein